MHVVGPEQGLTQPGMTIACGDCHTSTHGAFGAIAFGIGTTQVRDVLATQYLALDQLKVRRIEVNGKLRPGVYAKDVILHIIRLLGVQRRRRLRLRVRRHDASTRMSMDERMTVCNMSIEGGARVGYVNPDETTFAYLKGRPYRAAGRGVGPRRRRGGSRSPPTPTRSYDDVVTIDADDIEPTVTWGINPAQSVGDHARRFRARTPIEEALAYMGFAGGAADRRHEDRRRLHRLVHQRPPVRLRGSGAKFVQGPPRARRTCKALVVPGSQEVSRKRRSARACDKIFTDAGFEWRGAGCSMCLAMNPDKLVGDQLCASSSNRNFKGRQGSPTGRTLLMSPVDGRRRRHRRRGGRRPRACSKRCTA